MNATQLEVCTCCYLAAAGYSDHETGETHEHCQHDDGMPLAHHVGWIVNPGGEVTGPEGDDESTTFSKSRCEGCGSPLAGTRHYATVMD